MPGMRGMATLLQGNQAGAVSGQRQKLEDPQVSLGKQVHGM